MEKVEHMKKLLVIAIGSLLGAAVASAQIGRSLDWSSYANDNQRTGWEKSSARFSKDTIPKEFQFLWKIKPSGGGPHKLMPPMILGTLVGYRGFKELAFFGDANDAMYVYDADLDRPYWDKKFDYSAAKPKAGPTSTCPAGMTAAPTLISVTFRRPPPRPATPGAAAPRPTPNPLFGPRSVYSIASDGRLRRSNVADGSDMAPPAAVLPSNANVGALNINDMVIYTTTNSDCGGASNSVWAVDIGEGDTPVIKSYESKGGHFDAQGGVAIGNDGTVYAQGGAGDTLLALTPRDLQLKGAFKAPGGLKPDVTPVVFAHGGRDVIVSAGKDGRLYVADSKAVDSAPIAMSEPLGGSLYGGISTWAEQDGPRWVLATVWGTTGKIIALKLNVEGTKLETAWTSADLVKPLAPMIAGGAVFAISSGDAGKSNAVAYALDGTTGKELWSSKNQITAAGNLTGFTMANGRLYLPTVDGSVWVFGIPLIWD